jgi:hypothetical protein
MVKSISGKDCGVLWRCEAVECEQPDRSMYLLFLQLVSKEDENVTLAHYVGRSVLGDKKAVLVVDDAGTHILEFIIVSFIFVEKIRRERVEKSAGAYQGS